MLFSNYNLTRNGFPITSGYSLPSPEYNNNFQYTNGQVINQAEIVEVFHVEWIANNKVEITDPLLIANLSTDEEKRYELFGNADVLSIEEVISIVNKKVITNRTVTLNFIVMENIEVSVDKLYKMGLGGDKFVVKLIPLNATHNANNNNILNL
jgi:ABC-type transport system substrate-binding protein